MPKQQMVLQGGQLTNIMCSSCGLCQLLLMWEAFDSSVQHQMLLDCNLRPEDIELGANTQVLPDGMHAGLDAHAIDNCIACSRNK